MASSVVRLFALAGALLSASPAMAQDVFAPGDVVRVDYISPTIMSVQYGANLTPPGSGASFFNGALRYDVNASDITIQGLAPGYTFTAESFNGFRLSDINGTLAPFTDFAFNASASNVAFAPGRVTFDANNLFTNFQGLTINAGDVLVFQINAAPEPAAWALMILGFGAAGGALRRQRGARAADQAPGTASHAASKV